MLMYVPIVYGFLPEINVFAFVFILHELIEITPLFLHGIWHSERVLSHTGQLCRAVKMGVSVVSHKCCESTRNACLITSSVDVMFIFHNRQKISTTDKVIKY